MLAVSNATNRRSLSGEYKIKLFCPHVTKRLRSEKVSALEVRDNWILLAEQNCPTAEASIGLKP